MPDDIVPQSVTIPRLLTLLAVADRLALSPHTIRALVRRGRLHPVRICRRLLFDPREIERFIAECR